MLGIGRFEGGARGLVWLQKSTSGVRSARPGGVSGKLSLWRSGLAIGPCAPVVKERWKLALAWKHVTAGGMLLEIPGLRSSQAQAEQTEGPRRQPGAGNPGTEEAVPVEGRRPA